MTLNVKIASSRAHQKEVGWWSWGEGVGNTVDAAARLAAATLQDTVEPATGVLRCNPLEPREDNGESARNKHSTL